MRWPTRPAAKALLAPVARVDCRCGHLARGHEHYRRGTDCAFCACRRYRSASVVVPAVSFRERPAVA